MIIRWKGITALGLSALIGCMAPVSTTMAAAEETETAESVQETEVTEPAAEIIPQAAETAAESVEQEQSDKAAAPVIVIQLQGANRAQALGGTIEYNTYIGNRDQRLSISASQGSDPVSFYYYLDTAVRVSDESKNEEQLSGLWQPAEQATGQEVSLGQDGAYVLYVKAEAADGQISYARTDGIVIDATAPVITGIDNGGTYPEGTYFGVTDDNLESVLMNEQPAALSQTDGMYRVTAAQYSTSCVIRAKDKAGNETVYSITVGKKDVEDDTNVISKTGVYSLKAGTAYRLGDGNWTLEGDSTVYRGGSTFYVREDGSYHFTQHMK